MQVLGCYTRISDVAKSHESKAAINSTNAARRFTRASPRSFPPILRAIASCAHRFRRNRDCIRNRLRHLGRQGLATSAPAMGGSAAMTLKTLKPRIKTMAPTGPKSVSQTTRIRGSALQKIRREKLLKNPACEICAKQGIVTPAVVVDHIMPIWAGGAESDANRCSICHSCHSKKSALEAKARASGGALQD